MPINITEEFICNLMEQNSALIAQVADLSATVESLNQTIKELQEQINKNSKNSSKPPSSDGLKKPPVNKDKSLRGKSGKKPGAQNGHNGANLSVLTNPDEVEHHMHQDCTNCPYHDSCLEKACIKETRKELDAVVRINTTAHELILVKDCPMHGGNKLGTFPENIKAAVQYGKNLQALVIALNTVGAVSVNRTHEILSGVFDIPLATGTIKNMVTRFSDALSETYEKIRKQMILLNLIHCDETGTRVDGKTWWVHNASDAEFTFLSIDMHHGSIGMNAAGILPNYSGITVHDCWGSYWKYTDCIHAICCAHLLRELNGIEENHPEQTWAKEFKELLLAMKKVKDQAVEQEKDAISSYHLHKFDKRYDEIINTAYEKNPLPEVTEKKRGRQKKTKALSLICRLENYKASVCLFLKNLCVPFDNNQAERDLRMIKVKTKVSGCFRSEEGAQEYLTIMSYIGTAHKHGLNAFTAIREALSGNPDIIFD